MVSIAEYSQLQNMLKLINVLYTYTGVNWSELSLLTSVADPDPDPDPVFFGHPDPDPGKYRIRIRILYPQKDPMLFKFSRYKIV